MDEAQQPPLSVDASQYSEGVEGSEGSDSPYQLNEFDALRSAGRDWQYLLKLLDSGILFCVRRGKYLIIAAGRVSACLAFCPSTLLTSSLF
jgi:hypothetical protein